MSAVNPQDIFNYFTAAGYPASGAAAIVGNAAGESGFNSSIVGDSGRSYGLWQLGPTNQGLFAQMNGGQTVQNSTWQQQADFVLAQLQTPQYASTNAQLMSGGSVASATQAFMAGFERPANMSSLGSRIASATSALSGVAGNLANQLVPGLSTVNGVLSKFGIGIPGLGGGSSWLQQLEDWIKNSHFWQRIAIGVLALIFIGGAIFLLGNKIIKTGKS